MKKKKQHRKCPFVVRAGREAEVGRKKQAVIDICVKCPLYEHISYCPFNDKSAGVLSRAEKELIEKEYGSKIYGGSE